MEMVTFVFEFVPGDQVPPHTHPGQVLATVVEGEVTIRMEGTDHTYKQGDSWTETPGIVHAATNTAAGRTRVMVSILVPKGAPPSQIQPGGPSPAPPAPTPLYLSRTEVLVPAAPYEVAQAVLDFAPGARIPPHTHPGPVSVTVLDGAITLRTQGTEKTHQVGETFIEVPGVVFQATNAGSTPATVMVTYLVPKGAPLASPVASMPHTGAGGMATELLGAWPALVAGGGLVVGAWLARRQRRSR
jgi:quercetin dioxygenase-like cupin family protein